MNRLEHHIQDTREQFEDMGHSDRELDNDHDIPNEFSPPKIHVENKDTGLGFDVDPAQRVIDSQEIFRVVSSAYEDLTVTHPLGRSGKRDSGGSQSSQLGVGSTPQIHVEV